MTNEEIDMRLRVLALAIPKRKENLLRRDKENSVDLVRDELELANMSLVGIWTMLGEIAKRLPEVKP